MSKDRFMTVYHLNMMKFWIGMDDVFLKLCDKAMKNNNMGLYHKFEKYYQMCDRKYWKHDKRIDRYLKKT